MIYLIYLAVSFYLLGFSLLWFFLAIVAAWIFVAIEHDENLTRSMKDGKFHK